MYDASNMYPQSPILHQNTQIWVQDFALINSKVDGADKAPDYLVLLRFPRRLQAAYLLSRFHFARIVSLVDLADSVLCIQWPGRRPPAAFIAYAVYLACWCPAQNTFLVLSFHFVTDQISGPAREIGPICMSLCPDNNFWSIFWPLTDLDIGVLVHLDAI